MTEEPGHEPERGSDDDGRAHPQEAMVRGRCAHGGPEIPQWRRPGQQSGAEQQPGRRATARGARSTPSNSTSPAPIAAPRSQVADLVAQIDAAARVPLSKEICCARPSTRTPSWPSPTVACASILRPAGAAAPPMPTWARGAAPAATSCG